MLSDSSKAQTRLYLGFPDQYRYQNTRLESVLNDLSPDAETQIASILTTIASVETALLSAGIQSAGIKRIDEIWFDGGKMRASEMRKYGRMLAARLSIICGVPIYSDVFGVSGYLGDSFLGSTGGARYGNGFRLG